MSDLNQLITVLSTNDAIRDAAFCAGFSWSYGAFSDLFEYPFSTMLDGSFGGFIATIAASIVVDWIPHDFRPVLSVVLFGSTLRYFIKSLSKKPRPERLRDDGREHYGIYFKTPRE